MLAISRRHLLRDVLVVVLAVAVDLAAWQGDRQLRGGELLPVWVVPAFTIGIYSMLLFRWRRPVEVFAIQWVYGLAGLLVPSYVPFACLLVALHGVASRRSGRVSAAAFAACAIPFGIDSFNAASATTRGEFLTNLAISGLLYFASAFCAWALGRRTYLADRRVRVMQDLQAEQQAQALRTERLRLARELHDIVAHAVTAMILQAAGARTLVNLQDERVRQALATIESAGVQAMNELHRLLGLLRTVDPDLVADINDQYPGLEDVPALVDFSRASGLHVDLAVEGRPAQLDRSVDLAAYRVIQEALTNAAKHGGPAVSVCIHYSRSKNQLDVSVHNQGGLSQDHVDAETMSSGRGLIGLAERVSLVGGRLEAGPVGDGFLVRVELPLSRTDADQSDIAALRGEDDL